MKNHGGSFIQCARTKKNIAKAILKQANLSMVQRKAVKSIMTKGPLAPIQEEEESPIKRVQKKPSKDKFKNAAKIQSHIPLPEVKPSHFKQEIHENNSALSDGKSSNDGLKLSTHPKRQPPANNLGSNPPSQEIKEEEVEVPMIKK